MNREEEMKKLRKEIHQLSMTVSNLEETIGELKSKVERNLTSKQTKANAQYDVFANQQSVIERDMSWERLIGLLEDTERGLTAQQLARKWGRSRSRTSEVLNTLVDEGRLVKFRDGRHMRFIAPDEEV
ncbi:MAG: helix-turn-helix domain-containing protein [Candidatus Lokiarchaeota archaeon]|nr:helix-turn-helix domain-containing protein [Candidatus Lokiarchaeota archaeon]